MEKVSEQSDFELDFRLLLPDGSIKYIHSTGHPIVDERGLPVQYLCTHIDLTERMRAEQQLQNSFAQLRALAARLQSVREEERTRVAREIHDELGQALTSIKLDLASVMHDLEAHQKPQPSRVESALEAIDQTIQSMRRIATELRPAVLDALGLVAAIEWAAEEFGSRTGTKCRLELPADEIAIDHEAATALFRIFQETLTNVARHAGATEVDVRLVQENGSLLLEVRDNGRGIAEQQLSSSASLGIVGMRERALLLGGKLTISGQPGTGTTVTVTIPQRHHTPTEHGK
jgi:signal transduction histidine kinase